MASRPPDTRPFRSLSTTLVRSIVVAGAICTVTVATLQLAFTYHAQRNNFAAEVQSIAQINVPLLSVNLWDIEPEAIRRQLRLMAERPQISHVRLEAVSGQEFESGNHARRGDRRAIVLDVPYPSGKPGRLGTLEVAPNVDHLYGELANDLLKVLAGCVLLTASICWVVAVILRRQLQLPMQRIAKFSAGLKPQQLARPLDLYRPQWEWRDEIDEVADGFRVLQDDIHTHVEKLDHLVAQRTEELKNVNARLQALAHLDPLTGLSNRRHFDQERVRAWEQMLSTGLPLSIMMIDIDYFKQYNDTYGHAEGDDCLIAIARALAGSFQEPGRLPVRMGGEEFAVMLENVPLEGALARAEDFCSDVYALAVPHMKSAHRRVTVSIGVSAVDPRDLPAALLQSTASSGMTELLGHADRALYDAKAAGRNRVIGAPLSNKLAA